MALLLKGEGVAYQQWMERQLEAYADRHAGSRADHLEACASGELASDRAEYLRDSIGVR
jgi:hypothetical protein